jgi:hypothetical protein
MVDAQDDWNSSSISCGTAKYCVMFVVRWPMARGQERPILPYFTRDGQKYGIKIWRLDFLDRTSLTSDSKIGEARTASGLRLHTRKCVLIPLGDRSPREVQAALDHPDESVSHDEVWTRLEQRMKRAVARAA